VRDASFEVVDADKDPLRQPRRLLRRGRLVVVELTNSTADANGSRRVKRNVRPAAAQDATRRHGY
jgi:hypothetical protein